jgi:hypothetical protein
MQMRILTLFLFVIVFSTNSTPTMSAQEEPVWFWFATCGGPAMTLELQLDKVAIYQSTFPLCRAERSSADSQARATAEFVFRPERAITWKGYRDNDVTSQANQRIEANLWQAGADPDSLLIGVTFSDDSQIYMNTIYIAYPSRREETSIADGLVIATYPAASR